MDFNCIDCVGGRRGRKRRGHSRTITLPCLNRNHSNPRPFLSCVSNLLIMSSLMALIYLMLEYHCTTCAAKCSMMSITTNIDNIAKNISMINYSYQELESKVRNITQQLPKIEGQIDVLEALANTLESGDKSWNPKQHLTLPNVDVFLCKTKHGRNVSRKCSKRFVKYPTVSCSSHTCMANKNKTRV